MIIEEIKNYPAATTPMMRQYLNIKQAYKDCMLFFRMGDFYELFFDDAIKAAEILDITLTKRGKHQENDIPMCGVPYHSSEPYMHKLIEAGYKVAICEQMESPEEAKKRGGYSTVVKREVIRIITAGTITEETLLEANSANYLCSVVQIKDDLALAWVDISTGLFYVQSVDTKQLNSELARINPKEILLSEKLYNENEIRLILTEWKNKLTTHVESFFDKKRCENRLLEFYEINNLESLYFNNPAQISACGSIIEYISITQIGHLPKLNFPQKQDDSQYMIIDASTRKNLELNKTLSGNYNGSFLNIINKTISGGGGRLLRHFLNSPLYDVDFINHRLEAVEFFIKNNILKDDVRKILYSMPDLERSLSRICLKRATTRDILSIRIGLKASLELASLFENVKINNMPNKLQEFKLSLNANQELIELLEKAVNDEVPFQLKEGGFVKNNYNLQLDHYRNLHLSSNTEVMKLRDKYREITGISNLKITHNNVLGFYIEITAQYMKKMNLEIFKHKQTLANSVRYTSAELIQLETEIVSAKDKIYNIETEIFNYLLDEIKNCADYIILNANAINHLDVFSAFAELAIINDYCKPIINHNYNFEIIGGRHPVVEANIKHSAHEKFVANDCILNHQEQIWLITGPNMAGKSTYLRQNALITIMAQMGSFVPAKKATIGIVDKLFSRVGASDDLARGKSTFMIEMLETALILNQATNRSLVILDEIGRGTATYDGLSIAYATLEYLHNELGVRSLFATHYHELTSLADRLQRLKCYTMKVKEWQGNVIFLHQIIKGIAASSYGIYVAKIAGVPKSVIKRAEEVLIHLNNDNLQKKLLQLPEEMPLFASNNSASIKMVDNLDKDKPELNIKYNNIYKILSEININELSPKDAWVILDNLKNIYEG